MKINTCFYKLVSIECNTQKNRNIAKKNRNESINVKENYLGNYSALKIAIRALKKYIKISEDYICFAGFRITKEYVDDFNHLSFYEPDMTYIYDNKGNYITKLEGCGKTKNDDKIVYWGIDDSRITLKVGDFIMFQCNDVMIPGMIVRYPLNKKEWKAYFHGEYGSNDYEAIYIVATGKGYEHPFINNVFPAVIKPSKTLIKKFRNRFIKHYCNDINDYNKHYKKIFDKVLSD